MRIFSRFNSIKFCPFFAIYIWAHTELSQPFLLHLFTVIYYRAWRWFFSWKWSNWNVLAKLMSWFNFLFFFKIVLKVSYYFKNFPSIFNIQAELVFTSILKLQANKALNGPNGLEILPIDQSPCTHMGSQLQRPDQRSRLNDESVGNSSLGWFVYSGGLYKICFESAPMSLI